MKPTSKSYEFNEYTAEQAHKDNFEWFSSLSPARKIRAIEVEIKAQRYFQSLKADPKEKLTLAVPAPEDLIALKKMRKPTPKDLEDIAFLEKLLHKGI